MPETEQKPKLFKYSRTFEAAEKEKQPAEMDKDALKAYIREILGTVAPEAKSESNIS